MKQNVLSFLLCLCLIAGFLSGFGQTALASSNEPADGSVEFSAEGPVVSGNGLKVTGKGNVKISEPGTYTISGVSDAARIVVEAAETDEVTLILNGCDLTCPDNEVIYFKTAARGVIVLAEGTENTLTSGTEASETEEAETETAVITEDGDALSPEEEDPSGAALRSKAALTITGAGSLTVSGYINNGIAAVGDLTVEEGSIAITSTNDALKSRAILTISGGSLDIRSQADGVQADGGLVLLGGEVNIVTGGGAAAAKRSSGGPFGRSPWDADDSDDVSRKGLKSDGDIIIQNGTFTLDTEDDAVHAKGSIEYMGGELTAASGDDGVHADGQITVFGGTIVVTRSYEGVEAKAVVILDGIVGITSSDDGINVNGGDFGWFGRSSAQTTETEDDGIEPMLRIAGGTVLVDASGDGLDSNSDLFIEGGTILVSGPSDNFNAALDHGDGGYDFFVTGGTLMAAGSSGMAESPSVTSGSQPSILYVREDGSCAAGDTVTLMDADGNVLLTSSFGKRFNCVVLSCPEMEVGQTYTLVMGNHETTITLSSTTYSNRRGGFGFGW